MSEEDLKTKFRFGSLVSFLVCLVFCSLLFDVSDRSSLSGSKGDIIRSLVRFVVALDRCSLLIPFAAAVVVFAPSCS